MNWGPWTCLKGLEALATNVLGNPHWSAHGWFHTWVTDRGLCLPLIPVWGLLGPEQRGLCWSSEFMICGVCDIQSPVCLSCLILGSSLACLAVKPPLSRSATSDSFLAATDGETSSPAKARKGFEAGTAADVWCPRAEHTVSQHDDDQIQVRPRLGPDATPQGRGGRGRA